MRLFLAVDLDDATRQAAADWMRDLADRLGPRQVREIKWVEPGNLHLTVHFFGHVDPARGEQIRQTLVAPPLPASPFELRIETTGTFPVSGPARVIWLGVKDDRGGFAALHRDVQVRLATIGLAAAPGQRLTLPAAPTLVGVKRVDAQEEADARPFTPHLTLGRVRTPSGPLGRAIRAVLPSAPATFGRFLVRNLTLYESRLSPKGPTYIPVDRVRLDRAR